MTKTDLIFNLAMRGGLIAAIILYALLAA